MDLKDNGRVNIAARLALANLLFVQGNHASALERQVIRACICMDMHVHLAMCLFVHMIAYLNLQSYRCAAGPIPRILQHY